MRVMTKVTQCPSCLMLILPLHKRYLDDAGHRAGLITLPRVIQGYTPATFIGGHTKTAAELSHVRWVSHCRDLVQLPVAA